MPSQNILTLRIQCLPNFTSIPRTTCLQTFVHKCIFGKIKKKTHETFHILKMKAHFKKEQHLGNESSFLKMKTQPFLKLQSTKSIKKGSRVFVGAKFN